jgi:DNA-binding CsgD family transcriptional regulator
VGSQPVLAGRVGEQRTLLHALTSPAGQRGILVVGEAGIGKTRLVSAVSTTMAERGAMVTVGHCLPLGATLPFLPIVEALRGLQRRQALTAGLARSAPHIAREVARLLPDLGNVEGDDGPGEGWRQARLFAALADLFGALADADTLVLVVEDLHWADSTTLDFLAYLTSLGSETGDVRLLATCREEALEHGDALASWVEEMDRRGSVTQHRLAPLSRSETGEQVAAIIGRPPQPDFVADVYTRTGGNPFFAEQLLAARADPSATASLTQLLLARVRQGGPQAGEVLAAVAVAGRPLEEAQLATLTGLPTTMLRPLLRQLVGRRLLDRDGDARYQPRHALLAEAVAADLPIDERRRRHAAVAELLSEAERVDAAEIARHWSAAGVPVHELLWCVAAGRQAEAVYAWQEAARHWTRVLQLWDQVSDSARPAELGLFELYDHARTSLERAEDIEGAEALAEQQLDRFGDSVDVAARADMWRTVAKYRTLTDATAAIAANQIALDLYEQLPPGAGHAEALLDRARLLNWTGDFPQALAVGERGLAIAEQAQSSTQRVNALTVLAIHLVPTDPHRALAMAARAVEIASSECDDETVVGAQGEQVMVLYDLGRLEDVVAAANSVQATLARLGLRRFLWHMNVVTTACDALLRLGRVSAATDLIFPLATGPISRATVPLHDHRSLIEVLRGEYAAAEQRVRELEQMVRPPGFWFDSTLVFVSVELALWRGEPDAALALAVPMLESIAATSFLREYGHGVCQAMRAFADAAQRARDRGDSSALEALVKDADRVALLVEGAPADPFSGYPTATADQATCEAERARLRGTPDVAAWRAAAAEWEARGEPHRAGYAYWRLAEAILETGQPTADAAHALRRAYQHANEHVPMRAEIRSLATRARMDLDADRRPHSQVESPQNLAKGPAAPSWLATLTTRELQVLKLLCSGRTNAQIGNALFMSTKTASVHVSHILRKLGATNRVQAAGIAARAGIGNPTANQREGR